MSVFVRKIKKNAIKLLISSVIVYAIFVLINQQTRIKNKEEELEKVNAEILIEKSKSDEINAELDKSANGDISGGKFRKRIFENVVG